MNGPGKFILIGENLAGSVTHAPAPGPSRCMVLRHAAANPRVLSFGKLMVADGAHDQSCVGNQPAEVSFLVRSAVGTATTSLIAEFPFDTVPTGGHLIGGSEKH